MKTVIEMAREALEYIYEGANNQGPHTGISWRCVSNKAKPAITALRQAFANEALDKMAENARELGLDYEPAQNNPLDCNVYLGSGKDYAIKHHVSYGPAQQEPVAWKLVPREPTHEMLKAMDECSTEGYDERLYAGHAASVYMAAVDAAPTPPAQHKPLSDEQQIAESLRVHGLTLVKTTSGYEVLRLGQITANNIKENT